MINNVGIYKCSVKFHFIIVIVIHVFALIHMCNGQVSTAVQVFQNLGIISSAVDTTIESTLVEIERISTESLDVSLVTNQDFGKRGAPGRAAIPSPGSSGNLRTRIWENLERLFQDTLYTQCLQVNRPHYAICILLVFYSVVFKEHFMFRLNCCKEYCWSTIQKRFMIYPRNFGIK